MNCPTCTKSFIPKSLRFSKYCTIKCAAILRGRNQRGSSHWNWKGGKDTRWIRKTAPRPRPELCEICKLPGKKRNGITLDHNHKTGKFRGWLCSNCNTTIGLVHEDIRKLDAIKQYLIDNENPL